MSNRKSDGATSPSPPPSKPGQEPDPAEVQPQRPLRRYWDKFQEFRSAVRDSHAAPSDFLTDLTAMRGAVVACAHELGLCEPLRMHELLDALEACCRAWLHAASCGEDEDEWIARDRLSEAVVPFWRVLDLAQTDREPLPVPDLTEEGMVTDVANALHAELPDIPADAGLLSYLDLASAPQLAKLLGKSVNAVDAFLRRHREKYPDCFREVEGGRRNEPNYFYRSAAVLPYLRTHFGLTDS